MFLGICKGQRSPPDDEFRLLARHSKNYFWCHDALLSACSVLDFEIMGPNVTLSLAELLRLSRQSGQCVRLRVLKNHRGGIKRHHPSTPFQIGRPTEPPVLGGLY